MSEQYGPPAGQGDWQQSGLPMTPGQGPDQQLQPGYGQPQHQQQYQQQHQQQYQQQPYQPYPQAPPPYGAPPGYGYPPQYVVQQAPSNGIGVGGFVCGLLGLIFFWIPFVGLVLGILGVILGGAGISSGRKSGAGTGLAVAGLVLGVISLVPAVIVISALASN